MIIVIHDPPRRLFDYWQKPVKDRLGRSGQNHRFSAVIRLQNRSYPFLDGDENWLQPENNSLDYRTSDPRAHSNPPSIATH
jgi:hypothetical protein